MEPVQLFIFILVGIASFFAIMWQRTKSKLYKTETAFKELLALYQEVTKKQTPR
jgi:hypothetical protein